MELQITEYALDLTEEVTNLTINEFGMAVGPTGATGPEGLVWKGAWSAGTAYVVDDAVSYNGSAYICIANVITTDPTNATYWSILASKGDTGATGATGATGLGVPTTTAANDFAVGNGSTWDKKTLDETLAILGFPSTTAANDFMVGSGSAWQKKTLAETKIVLGATSIGGVAHKQLWIAGWKPTLTSGCASSAQLEMTTNKNVYDYLAFDKDTIEYAYANVAMPDDYSGGNVYAKYYWLHPATTTNFGVLWALSGVAITDDGTLDVAQGTYVYTSDTGGTTNDLYISGQSTAITIAGTPAAGKYVHWKLFRGADNATYDTLAVDAYLLGVMIWYPVN